MKRRAMLRAFTGAFSGAFPGSLSGSLSGALSGALLGADRRGLAAPLAARPDAPSPVGAVPSPRQAAWQVHARNGFVHFGMNTFTGREWGYGDDDPRLFDPSDFSATQIVSALRAGGLDGVILTAKHHDGFCLWPSDETDYSVARSPFRGGRGDVVGEMAAACASAGMRLGLYLSPWDRHRADYGTPAYVAHYKRQLRELLTRYGPLFEIWFDGANGGDGWYGGACAHRRIDADRYYDWDALFAMVRRHQPDAVIFAPKGGDIRWIGNEAGLATPPCWPTMPVDRPGAPVPVEMLEHGVFRAPLWRPAEVDVSIRPGWFYHPEEDEAVRPAAALYDLSRSALGLGLTLLLNVPPDRSGRIAPADAQALAGSKKLLDALFARNLAQGGAIAGADGLLADDARYWMAPVDARSATLVLRLPRTVMADVIELAEPLWLGLRVRDVVLTLHDGHGGAVMRRATGIGLRRLLVLDRPTPIRVMEIALSCPDAAPALRFVALRRQPHRLYPPVITRDAACLVTITGSGAVEYALGDGPPVWRRYRSAFRFESGMVRARNEMGGGMARPVAVARFGLPASQITVTAASAPGADAILKAGTSPWISPATEARPAFIVVRLARPMILRRLVIVPGLSGAVPPDTSKPGPPHSWRLVLEGDAAPIAEGRLDNVMANDAPRSLRFETTRAIGGFRLVFPGVAPIWAPIAVRHLTLFADEPDNSVSKIIGEH